MLGLIKGLFSGGAVKSIENIATEYLGKEANGLEANALLVKALDPNGIMRREISSTVRKLYGLYLLTLFILSVYMAFGDGDIKRVELAINSLTELFLPITAMFTSIVYASFGVNVYNVKKEN